MKQVIQYCYVSSMQCTPQFLKYIERQLIFLLLFKKGSFLFVKTNLYIFVSFSLTHTNLCNHDKLAEEAKKTEKQEEYFSTSSFAQHHGVQVHH